jgi:hypothetical protein
MTPEQKLRHLILLKDISYGSAQPLPEIIDSSNIDQIFFNRNEDDDLGDAMSEVRESGIETNLATPYSRYYEAMAHATQYLDGSWIGWTYWYGGGKHGQPDSMPWIEDAYNLDCTEEEKLVVVRTFTRL